MLPAASPSPAVQQQLTLATQLLRIPNAFTRHSMPSAEAMSAYGGVQLHTAWIDRMGWSIDDPMLVCRAIPASSTSTAAIPNPLSFTCQLTRLCALDPRSTCAWTAVDFSQCTGITIAGEIDFNNWQQRDEILFEEREEEARERAERIKRREEKEKEDAKRLKQPVTPIKTPVKSKPTIMQLPSASSQAMSPAPSTPSFQSTLAASARIYFKLRDSQLPQSFFDVSNSSSPLLNLETSSVYLIPFRQKTAVLRSITRIVFEPFIDIAAESAASTDEVLTADELRDLAAMVRRSIMRQYICGSGVIDVRHLPSPMFKRWKHLRVKEIAPINEVGEVTKTTQIFVEIAPQAPDALKSQSVAAQSLDKASQAHPALAALYSLLLPPLLYPQAFEHLRIDPPKGLLLSGPPGVGKSYSVASVCRSLGVKLFTLDGASVYGAGEGVAGAAEETLREKFREASSCPQPSVLFIDEIDVLCPHRTNESAQLSNRLVAQLLSLMDGLEARGHLLCVGATNHPNSLDAALRRPGRFDRELRLDPPSVSGRVDLLKGQTESMPVHDRETTLQAVAQRTIGYVAADLAALVREAAQIGLKEYRHNQLAAANASTQVSSSPLPPSITLEHFLSAMLLVPSSSLRGNGALSSKPTTSFASIGGLEDVKTKLQQAVEWPLKHATTFERLGLKPPRGILLYGPPGCAKTSLVRAIAAGTSAAFLPLDTASLYSCYVGEAERILRSLFSRARANRPCVLFLDEIDAMVHKREMGGGAASGGGDAHSLEARILSTLLNEMDGMVSSQGLLVVAATNRLDMLDEALLRPGRFDQIIYVPPPDAASRLAILQLHTRGMLATPDAPETIAGLRTLADKLERYTGADIANLCRETALEVLRTNFTQEKVLLSDLERTAAATQPSLTESMIQHYAQGKVRT